MFYMLDPGRWGGDDILFKRRILAFIELFSTCSTSNLVGVRSNVHYTQMIPRFHANAFIYLYLSNVDIMQVGVIKMAHWTDLGKLLNFAIRFGVELIEALGMLR